MNCAVEDTS